jgi:hypothetical protein
VLRYMSLNSDIKDAQQKISELVFTRNERVNDVIIKNEPVTSNNIYLDQHQVNENPALNKYFE